MLLLTSIPRPFAPTKRSAEPKANGKELHPSGFPPAESAYRGAGGAVGAVGVVWTVPLGRGHSVESTYAT